MKINWKAVVLMVAVPIVVGASYAPFYNEAVIKTKWKKVVEAPARYEYTYDEGGNQTSATLIQEERAYLEPDLPVPWTSWQAVMRGSSAPYISSNRPSLDNEHKPCGVHFTFPVQYNATVANHAGYMGRRGAGVKNHALYNSIWNQKVKDVKRSWNQTTQAFDEYTGPDADELTPFVPNLADGYTDR